MKVKIMVATEVDGEWMFEVSPNLVKRDGETILIDLRSEMDVGSLYAENREKREKGKES